MFQKQIQTALIDKNNLISKACALGTAKVQKNTGELYVLSFS
jgi:hypothetical protein